MKLVDVQPGEALGGTFVTKLDQIRLEASVYRQRSFQASQCASVIWSSSADSQWSEAFCSDLCWPKTRKKFLLRPAESVYHGWRKFSQIVRKGDVWQSKMPGWLSIAQPSSYGCAPVVESCLWRVPSIRRGLKRMPSNDNRRLHQRMSLNKKMHLSG